MERGAVAVFAYMYLLLSLVYQSLDIDFRKMRLTYRYHVAAIAR
jgi:hypothetical protein